MHHSWKRDIFSLSFTTSPLFYSDVINSEDNMCLISVTCWVSLFSLSLTSLLIIDLAWHLSFPWSSPFFILLKINYYIREINMKWNMSRFQLASQRNNHLKKTLFYTHRFHLGMTVLPWILLTFSLSVIINTHLSIGYRNSEVHTRPVPTLLTHTHTKVHWLSPQTPVCG